MRRGRPRAAIEGSREELVRLQNGLAFRAAQGHVPAARRSDRNGQHGIVVRPVVLGHFLGLPFPVHVSDGPSGGGERRIAEGVALSSEPGTQRVERASPASL